MISLKQLELDRIHDIEMLLAIGIVSLRKATKNLSMKVIYENIPLKPGVFFSMGPFENQVKATDPFSKKITRVGTLIVATIYLELIQNRYMFRSFTVLQCSHQHCVQPVASDVEVVGYL